MPKIAKTKISECISKNRGSKTLTRKIANGRGLRSAAFKRRLGLIKKGVQLHLGTEADIMIYVKLANDVSDVDYLFSSRDGDIRDHLLDVYENIGQRKMVIIRRNQINDPDFELPFG